MRIIGSQADLRAAAGEWRREKLNLGLVPTMGALHEGHFALVERARKENDRVAASLFVNPTQFGPNEDFTRYPRTPEEDAQKLSRAGVDLLYMPPVEDMYAEGAATTVHVRGITEYLDGPFRPGHFDGVATVVAKLFQRFGPCTAYFGEKDWQQLQVVKRLVRDLDFPVQVVGVPTVREADGLALSSRNRYLSAEERAKAALLPRVMKETAEVLRRDPRGMEKTLAAARARLTEAGFRLDYLELAEAASCAPVRALEAPVRLFVAARIGHTRLIDNWAV